MPFFHGKKTLLYVFLKSFSWDCYVFTDKYNTKHSFNTWLSLHCVENSQFAFIAERLYWLFCLDSRNTVLVKGNEIQLNVWWVCKCKHVENETEHFLQSRRKAGETEQPHFETQSYWPGLANYKKVIHKK